MCDTPKVCTADEDGPGCGAPLPRKGSDQEHLDHTSDCPRRYCVGCGTSVGGHFPGCSWPTARAA
jgi:hypothetical protein